MNIVWDTASTGSYGGTIFPGGGGGGGERYSLVNIVWDTASTGSYGGTVFPGGIHYSLVNNVCGIQYSLGYRIHSDRGTNYGEGGSAL